MNEKMNARKVRVETRVSEKEYQFIADLAKDCRLSIAEFVRSCALGFVLRPVTPDIYFTLCEKIDDLIANCDEPGFKEKAVYLLDLLGDHIIHELRR